MNVTLNSSVKLQGLLGRGQTNKQETKRHHDPHSSIVVELRTVSEVWKKSLRSKCSCFAKVGASPGRYALKATKKVQKTTVQGCSTHRLDTKQGH